MSFKCEFDPRKYRDRNHIHVTNPIDDCIVYLCISQRCAKR